MWNAKITHYYRQEKKSPHQVTPMCIHTYVNLYSSTRARNSRKSDALELHLNWKRKESITDKKGREGRYFVSSRGLSLLPKIIRTGRPPLPLWGAGHRDDRMGYPKSSPLRNSQSHAGHGAAISIPLNWGSCRALSPPHLLLHLSIEYLGYLGPETHRWPTGLYRL